MPGLLWPGIHAIAGGAALYFGSLLLCLHRGRWLGTRGVLLLALGGVFLLQMVVNGPPLLFPLVAAPVLFLAAWHAMYLDELDPHGTLLHSYEQAIDNRVPPDPRWLTTTQACLLPAAAAVWQHFHGPAASFPFSEAAMSLDLSVLVLDRSGWTVMILLAVTLAAIAFGWARWVGFTARQAGGWAAFVLAFGPAGLLAFRLAGRWPQRVRCPSCGYLRSLDKDACPHCQRAWAAPEATGTEIFEPLCAES